ncbi:MAG: hypothetical protein QNK23_14405 [Crocinitomicaceae bacterium]|nr:hypothetical protein [Crocinitomicaceae bacterium]
MRKDIPKGAYTSIIITNPESQLIADKLKFFVDCLSLVCLKSGEYYHYEVENHLSLLRNLIFFAKGEIDSITPKADRLRNTIKQIQYILKTHPLFQKEDGILSTELDRQVQIEKLLKEILNEPFKNKENLIKIREKLRGIEAVISPTYVDDLIQSLYSMVNCSHKLNHHKKGFEYLSRLVFSHFYNEGHSRERINGFIRKLLAKDITRQGDRIYTEAPLPPDLYQRLINHNTTEAPFSQTLSDDIQEYLDKRTLKQQIDGFVHISRYKKYPFKYIFRVDAIMIWSDSFELLDLSVFDINKFVKDHSDNELEFAKDFLERPNHSVLIEVCVDAYSHDEAVYVALSTLKQKLGILARRTRGRFSINQTGYTFRPSKGEQYWINTMPEPWKLSQFDIEHVEYMERKIASSQYKELYVQLENILTEGYVEDNINLSLHHFRRFMQVLFDNINTEGISNDSGVPKEIRVLAFLLVSFERDRFISEIHLWATNIVTNLSGPFGAGGDSANNLRQRIRETNGNITLTELVASVEQEHTKYEAKKAKYYSKKVDEQDVFEYYSRQLLFIKQYRDKHEHATFLDDQIARKLNLYSYKLMNRLLEYSFKELNKKKNKGISHQVALRNIVDSVLNKLEM